MENLLHERLNEYVAENGDVFDIDALKSNLGLGTVPSADDLNGCIRAIAGEIERQYVPRPRYEDGGIVEKDDELDGGRIGAIFVYETGWWVIEDEDGKTIDEGPWNCPVKRPVRPVQDYEPLDEKGRDAAVKYLEKRGYEIVERDWVCRFGEIDIIAKDPCGALCFTDVTTSKYRDEFEPVGYFDEIRREQFEKLALCYSMVRDEWCDDENLRYDRIRICITGKHRAMLTHVKGIF